MINEKKHNKGAYKQVIFLCFTMLVLSHHTWAQDSVPSKSNIFTTLQYSTANQGDIYLFQDELLNQLLETHVRMNIENGLIGYRIQINQWLGQGSREKAHDKEVVFLEKFPEFDRSLVYIEYEAPNYKLRVGDFRSRNDAFEFYNQVRRYFPNSYIVKTNINYPKLIVDNGSTEID